MRAEAPENMEPIDVTLEVSQPESASIFVMAASWNIWLIFVTFEVFQLARISMFVRLEVL